MKGTIRERKKADGGVSYLCQVPAGRDPGTGKRRFKTGVATSKREAHRLIHSLLEDATAEIGTVAAGTDRTVAELID